MHAKFIIWKRSTRKVVWAVMRFRLVQINPHRHALMTRRTNTIAIIANGARKMALIMSEAKIWSVGFFVLLLGSLLGINRKITRKIYNKQRDRIWVSVEWYISLILARLIKI